MAMSKPFSSVVVILLLGLIRACTAFHAAASIKPVAAGLGPSSAKKKCFPSVLSMSASDDGSGGGGSSSSSSSSSDNAVDQLRETASKLRAEAEAAEKALGSSRGNAAFAERIEYAKPVEYFDLDDSCWEITYRFANEPESEDDDAIVQRKFYSGKLRLQFRKDGYTDILPSSGEDDAATTAATSSNGNSNTATFRKVWGWDPETSEEDSSQYLLFSADIDLPPPISASERFYFQARVDYGDEKKNGDDDDGNAKNVLSLNDGSVTVKRNVRAPGGGWWGVFRGAEGILAQFRGVGEFRSRPIAKTNPDEPMDA